MPGVTTLTANKSSEIVNQRNTQFSHQVCLLTPCDIVNMEQFIGLFFSVVHILDYEA